MNTKRAPKEQEVAESGNGVTPETMVGYVLGDQWTVRYEESLPWHELFEEQEARLREEAERLGLPMDWRPPAKATPAPRGGGAEHEVWLGRDGRVYKLTKQDHFGQVPCHNAESIVGWENFAAAPADYLERLRLMNAVFGDAVRVEGVRCGRTVALAISQPLLKAARTGCPHPVREKKIALYMEARGFVGLGYHAWFHPAERLMVTDATPDNFIVTRKGLAPVDLMICRAHGELLRVLEEMVN
jgi:hypothetical protein